MIRRTSGFFNSQGEPMFGILGTSKKDCLLDERSSGVRLLALTAFFIAFIYLSISWGMIQPCGAKTKGSTVKTALDAVNPEIAYAGSKSCRECHEKFYTLWSTSMHGLAMQPYTDILGKEKLTLHKKNISIGNFKYRAEIGSGNGYLLETGADENQKKYPMKYALGGKNVYYFLTPMDRGYLQTLPLAYDVKKKEWFDTAQSGVRHFPGSQLTDDSVGWKERPYAFNASCHGCHVSQLKSNYDIRSDSYDTRWTEPGINCETCHGPSSRHNTAMRNLAKGEKVPDTIISAKKFTPDQHNDTCNACHAKFISLTDGYTPGERFFDHFDLVTIESHDFYPDGRDLGENYTMATWIQSPCVKNSDLNCLTCHTSSGRYRFKDPEKSNLACSPCHQEKLDHVASHTHHPPESNAGRCISCHMPKTEFARMIRSDHSMRPPTPAATLAFQSPNACNGCHSDKDAAWADKQLRLWDRHVFQAPVLKRAGLVMAARKGDWSQLPDILAYINDPQHDPFFTAGLIRLLAQCSDRRKIPMLRNALADPSPLVRSAAAETLGYASNIDEDMLQDLIAACTDDYRVVRVRAAGALAAFPNLEFHGETKASVSKATDEYLLALTARPDNWDSHFNLGNYYQGRTRPQEALDEYELASKFEPRAIQPLVNASLIHAQLGELDKAEKKLRKALSVAPDNASIHYNLGLLMAEKNSLPAAEAQLETALTLDPKFDRAAYNLSILLSKKNLEEAIRLGKRAVELRPDVAPYAYSLAIFLHRKGDTDEANRVLKTAIERNPANNELQVLLQKISS